MKNGYMLNCKISWRKSGAHEAQAQACLQNRFLSPKELIQRVDSFPNDTSSVMNPPTKSESISPSTSTTFCVAVGKVKNIIRAKTVIISHNKGCWLKVGDFFILNRLLKEEYIAYKTEKEICIMQYTGNNLTCKKTYIKVYRSFSFFASIFQGLNIQNGLGI